MSIDIEELVTIHVRPGNMGDALARSGSDEQAEFFLAFSRVADTYNWPQQCSYIEQELDPEHKKTIIYMLKSLLEHLEGEYADT